MIYGLRELEKRGAGPLERVTTPELFCGFMSAKVITLFAC
jgi:hypothetical protein